MRVTSPSRSPLGFLNRRRTEQTLAPVTPPGRRTAGPTGCTGSSSTRTPPLPERRSQGQGVSPLPDSFGISYRTETRPQCAPSSARPTSATVDTCPGRQRWSRWTSSSTARGCTRRPTDTLLPSGQSSSPPPGRSRRPACLQTTGHVTHRSSTRLYKRFGSRLT